MLIPVVARDPADQAQHFIPLQAILDARRHRDGDWEVLTPSGWVVADPEVMNGLCRLTEDLVEPDPPVQVRAGSRRAAPARASRSRGPGPNVIRFAGPCVPLPPPPPPQ